MSTAPVEPAVSTDVLRFLFAFKHRALGMNAADITHAESLVIAEPGTNCMNWMLGHIVSNRTPVLELPGVEPLWSEAEGEPYNEGGAWPDPVVMGRPWAALHASESRRPRGLQLHFMQFHEAYHIGQIGLMRRVVGKPGAI